MQGGPRQGYQSNDRGGRGGRVDRGKPQMGQRGGLKGKPGMPNQQFPQQPTGAMPNPMMVQQMLKIYFRQIIARF